MRFANSSVLDPVDASMQPLSLEEIIKRTEEYISGKGEIVINIPSNRNGVMSVQKGRTGFFALSHKDSVQWDRFNGKLVPFEIPVGYKRLPPNFTRKENPTSMADRIPNAREFIKVDVNRFSDKRFGEKVALSIRSLHFGDITGLSSKLVFGISCILATTFPITGVMLWIKKLRASRKRRKNTQKEQQKTEQIAESA
jgi:hypothetical protein